MIFIKMNSVLFKFKASEAVFSGVLFRYILIENETQQQQATTTKAVQLASL